METEEVICFHTYIYTQSQSMCILHFQTITETNFFYKGCRIIRRAKFLEELWYVSSYLAMYASQLQLASYELLSMHARSRSQLIASMHSQAKSMAFTISTIICTHRQQQTQSCAQTRSFSAESAYQLTLIHIVAIQMFGQGSVLAAGVVSAKQAIYKAWTVLNATRETLITVGIYIQLTVCTRLIHYR